MLSLSSHPQIGILLFVPKGIQNLLTIPSSRLLLSLCPSLLPPALLAGSIFFSNPETLPTELKLTLKCLNTQITLQYKHQKRATILIVTTLTNVNACNNNISDNNIVRSDTFYLFFFVFCFFSVIFYVLVFFQGNILFFV